ncbi:MAG: glycosyltransferase [Candidatus Sungbacteria bacterium]|nr:glycosyltransferase [Candidatus Sungbacteria bacterium]
MKVIFLSSDRLILGDSPARRRMAEYGRIFDEVHVIVFAKGVRRKENISANVSYYTTGSLSRWRYPFDAFLIAKAIIAKSGSVKGDFIVSAQDPFEAGAIAYWLKKRTGVPYQIQIHTDFLSPYFVKEHWENRLRLLTAGFILERADCIRAVSQRIVRSLVLRYPAISRERIAVLPVWGEPFSIHPVPEAGRFNILVVSRLEPEKGIDDALSAFKMFHALGGSGRLVIVGSGSQYQKLRKRAESQDIAPFVSFEGWQATLGKYYETADVFLMPSHYEGWGMAAYEAVRIGIPVVITNVGLAGEAVKDGENGLIVPVGDIEAMAHALLKVSRGELRFSGAVGADLPPHQKITGLRPWCGGLSATQAEYLEQYLKAMKLCQKPS